MLEERLRDPLLGPKFSVKVAEKDHPDDPDAYRVKGVGCGSLNMHASIGDLTFDVSSIARFTPEGWAAD
jgi:hypothetical protein